MRLTVAWLGLVLCMGGSTDAAPDLQPQRAEFTASLFKVSLPVLKQQVTDLLALEKKAAAAREYDTAIAARDERKKLELTIAEQEKLSILATAQTTPVAGADDDHINLKLSDAKLDHVVFDSAAGVLTDWSTAGASATWQLPNLPAGGYEIVLKYESGPLEGGSVLVQEKFYTLTADLQTTLKTAIEHNLGTLRLSDGATSLTISAKSVLKNNLMRLQSVELLPTSR